MRATGILVFSEIHRLTTVTKRAFRKLRRNDAHDSHIDNHINPATFALQGLIFAPASIYSWACAIRLRSAAAIMSLMARLPFNPDRIPTPPPTSTPTSGAG